MRGGGRSGSGRFVGFERWFYFGGFVEVVYRILFRGYWGVIEGLVERVGFFWLLMENGLLWDNSRVVVEGEDGVLD